MNIYDFPAENNDDSVYYQIFGRIENNTVQMFIADVQNGDSEYDDAANRLNLQSFSTVVHDFESAEEFAKKDARHLHADFPVEIRFMEDGEVAAPAGMVLIPKIVDKPKTCQQCGCDENGIEHWLSVYKWGYPFFCSRNCVNNWYEIPFITSVSGNSTGLSLNRESKYEQS